MKRIDQFDKRKRVSFPVSFLVFLTQIIGVDPSRFDSSAVDKSTTFAEIMCAATGKRRNVSAAVRVAIDYSLRHIDELQDVYLANTINEIVGKNKMIKIVRPRGNAEKYDIYLSDQEVANLQAFISSVTGDIDSNMTVCDAIRLCCDTYIINAPTGNPSSATTQCSRVALTPWMEALRQPLSDDEQSKAPAPCGQAQVPFRQPGSKSRGAFGKAVADTVIATSRDHIELIVDVCAGAGALRSHYYHVCADQNKRKIPDYIMNGIDPEKINVYKVITDDGNDLKTVLSGVISNVESSNKVVYSADVVQSFVRGNPCSDEIKHAIMYMSDHYSVGFCKTDPTDKEYVVNKLKAILRNCELLQQQYNGCTFTSVDLFELLKFVENLNVKCLLEIDPPYLETTVYKNNLASLYEHKRLADFLKQTKYIFKLYYRITPARAQRKTDGGLWKDWAAELTLTGFYHAQYTHRHYYYFDIIYRNGQNGCCIERVLTNKRMAKYEGWSELK